MTSRLYEFTVVQVDGKQVGDPVSCHVDLDDADTAPVLLADILVAAARRDGARREDVWKYRMQVREQGKQAVLLTYVVPFSRLQGPAW